MGKDGYHEHGTEQFAPILKHTPESLRLVIAKWIVYTEIRHLAFAICSIYLEKSSLAAALLHIPP